MIGFSPPRLDWVESACGRIPGSFCVAEPVPASLACSPPRYLCPAREGSGCPQKSLRTKINTKKASRLCASPPLLRVQRAWEAKAVWMACWDSGSAPAPADGLQMSARCLRPRSCLRSADGGRLSGLSRAAFFSDDGAARWEEDVQPISEWWFVFFLMKTTVGFLCWTVKVADAAHTKPGPKFKFGLASCLRVNR